VEGDQGGIWAEVVDFQLPLSGSRGVRWVGEMTKRITLDLSTPSLGITDLRREVEA
jgi:hypothetical protein